MFLAWNIAIIYKNTNKSAAVSLISERENSLSQNIRINISTESPATIIVGIKLTENKVARKIRKISEYLYPFKESHLSTILFEIRGFKSKERIFFVNFSEI